MTNKKLRRPEQTQEGESVPRGVLGSLLSLLKGSSILQYGLLIIMIAIALAIYSADEVSIFGIEIKGSFKTDIHRNKAPVTKGSSTTKIDGTLVSTTGGK